MPQLLTQWRCCSHTKNHWYPSKSLGCILETMFPVKTISRHMLFIILSIIAITDLRYTLQPWFCRQNANCPLYAVILHRHIASWPILLVDRLGITVKLLIYRTNHGINVVQIYLSPMCYTQIVHSIILVDCVLILGESFACFHIMDKYSLAAVDLDGI